MFNKGDVVRIKDSIAASEVNHKLIADHGYLWVVLDFNRVVDYVGMTMSVRSVASGEILPYARVACFEKPGES